MAFPGGSSVVFLGLLAIFGHVQCFERFAPSNTLLLSEFEYDTDVQHDLDRDLFPLDERSFFFHDPSDGDEVYATDYNLANLRPISPTPAFTLEPSYISPADVLPARAKRANRLRGRGAAKQQRKREQQREPLSEEEEEDEEEDDPEAAKEESTDVEDYAERYEQFIAKHFEDVEGKRKKSELQRKAPGKGVKANEDDDEEEEQDGDYKFDRFDYSSSEDYERIKAESEEQSRRLAKDPRNCRTYEKDGMVCSVCHDPASDSASESCAYATEPHHRKYAYVKERNYDSKKDDPNRKNPALEDEDEEDEHEAHELRKAETRPERQTERAGPNPTPAIRRTPAHPLRKPILRKKPHQSATNGGGYRYQPFDMRSNRASMKLRAANTDAETIPDTNIYVMDYDGGDQRQDDEVAKVLAEFRSRDWSNCRTKGKRTGDDDELTCYQCTDASGVNHEECMYVSESRLVASELPLPPAAATASSKPSKRKKVVALSRKQLAAPKALEPSATGPAKEKQTVKRTVSFRSFISGGRGVASESSHPIAAGSDDAGDARVIHYEHYISHEVP